MSIKRIIIGLIIVSIGFIIQPTIVHAFYSPVIAERASNIKANLRSAREQNGTGSIEDAFQNVIEQNKLAADRNEAQGLPPEVSATQSQILKDVFADILLKPLDDLFLIFNLIPSTGFSPASKCLRDDIWGLQNLRDAVVQEMIKSYLMYDRYHGDLLKKDYKWLVAHINILKKYGSKPMDRMLATVTENGKSVTKFITANEYLFGSKSDVNYYSIKFDGGCPQSEFPPAFNEVWESIQNVGVIASGSSVEWGSIWEMAEARARRRAAEWIKANQITLTIGGEEGGNPQSLIKGGGLDRFKGQWNTQLTILKNTVGPLVPLFSWTLFIGDDDDTINYGCMYFYQDPGIYRACTVDQLVDQLLDYKECQDDEDNAKTNLKINCGLYKNPKQITTSVKQIEELQSKTLEHEKTIQRAETAYIYNVQLNSVGEQAIEAIEAQLLNINHQIRAGFEAEGDSKSLPTIYKNLKDFTNKYCGGE